MNQNIYHTTAKESDASKTPHLDQNEQPRQLQKFYQDRKYLIQHYTAGLGTSEFVPSNLFQPFKFKQNLQRPLLVDFPQGTINVDGMKTEEITRLIQTIHQQPYCHKTTQLLADPKFRMIFQNMFQEPTSIVYRNMVPLQKEIDRMFFRVQMIDEEQEDLVLATAAAIHERDMPYRSLAFVEKLYSVCSEINRTKRSDDQKSYLNHILINEYDQVTVEDAYNERKKQCTKRNLNFAKVMDLYHYEHQTEASRERRRDLYMMM